MRIDMVEENVTLKRPEGFDFGDLRQTIDLSPDEVLERYERMKEENTPFSISFDMRSKGNGLFTFRDGIRIYLSTSKNGGEIVPYTLYGEFKPKVGDMYTVMVDRILKKERTVYVTSVQPGSETRKRLIEAILDGIGKKEYMRLLARVVGFTGEDSRTGARTDDIAMLNIGELGIIGVIPKKEWSTCYTSSFDGRLKKGDVVEVAIHKSAHWKTGYVFICSRRLIMEQDGIDPWEDIDKRVPKGTTIKLKCIQTNADGFFAVTDGLPEIEIICDYPKQNADFMVEVGKEYIAKIKRSEPERHRLTAIAVGSVL